MRFLLAVSSAKTAAAMIRLLKMGGGTTFPGQLATKLDPHCLAHLNGKLAGGSLVITGTNGKTTTASLISATLELAGRKPVHNKTGANLLPGITASFLQAANLWGRLDKDCAVLETDEAAFPKLCAAIHPRYVLVTNFFRDQLDRFGELDKTVALIRSGLQQLPRGTKVLLNADDPLVVSLSGVAGLEYLYYGLDDNALAVASMEQTSEGKFCPVCSTELQYSRYYYAHLGEYRCSHCGFQRPQPQLTARQVHQEGLKGSSFVISNAQGQSWPVRTALPGLYNLYNVLAAWQALTVLGVAPAQIQRGIERFQYAFGRMERFEVDGKTILMALVKNPTGCNEVIRTFIRQEGRLNLLLALNDDYADGTDVSWIWDVDYEQLQQAAERIGYLAATGTRGYDLAVRLKYAGIAMSKEQVNLELAGALHRALEQLSAGELLLIMPNYTSMLGLRKILADEGYAQQYWEE